jgi:dihydroorotase-like cyclic amidohydrolase
LSKFNQGPRSVLGISPCTIAEGQKAEFTIINPQHQTILTRRNNRSKSENTYYMDKPLPNFIEATFNGLHHVFNKNN